MSTQNILSIIAGYELALGTAQNVPGMQGFAGYYLKKLPPPHQSLLKKWIRTKQRMAGELADSIHSKPS